MRPLRSAIRLPACDARAAQFESRRMEPGRQSQNIPVQSAQTNAAAPPKSGNVRRSRPLRVLDVQIYRVCEDVTEGLIYLMVIFSPWAFGTTQPWSIWTMNLAGYLLGGY